MWAALVEEKEKRKKLPMYFSHVCSQKEREREKERERDRKGRKGWIE